MPVERARLWGVGPVVRSFLLFSAGPIPAWAASPPQQAIAFPGTGAIRSETRITDTRTGVTYKVKLKADKDVEGRPAVVNLTLQQAGSPQDGRNLLEPPGNWHGMEPFSIAARDFNSGALPAFGRHRKIPIQGSRSALLMDIKDVQVVDRQSKAGCAFSSVTIVVSIAP